MPDPMYMGQTRCRCARPDVDMPDPMYMVRPDVDVPDPM